MELNIDQREHLTLQHEIDQNQNILSRVPEKNTIIKLSMISNENIGRLTYRI